MTATLPLFLLLGTALGAAYFALLWRSLQLHGKPGNGPKLAAHLVVRLVGAGLVFWLAARAGAWPLLATFAGFLIGRFGALRLVRRKV